MQCISKNCQHELQPRTGRYGPFYYCPEHGTISAKGLEIFQAVTGSKETSGRVSQYTPGNDIDQLMTAIKRETLGFGCSPTDLEEWIVDDEDAPDYEPENWQNTAAF